MVHRVCMCACSVVSNSATAQTVVLQDPLFIEFSREKYWSGLPSPSSGHPDPGNKPRSLVSLALAGRLFTIAPPGSPVIHRGDIPNKQNTNTCTWREREGNKLIICKVL